jgi:hypothetical protein
MGYIRIIIHLFNGARRSGIRPFPEPMNLDEIRKHARQLASDVLGNTVIEDVTVSEVTASDPEVVALILGQIQRSKPVPRSDGEHPYLKHQQKKLQTASSSWMVLSIPR